ncbi:MAG: hypothetical protein M1834_000422 [Cirrosporium novae-zelandiae]|nr:MAG: hypothetical protein M1834_000422 [Cirrosporium novae-zelandiae]
MANSNGNLSWSAFEQGRYPTAFLSSSQPDSGDDQNLPTSHSIQVPRQRSGYGRHSFGGDGQGRRSSFNAAIATMRQVGGVNSFDNFARSWQRAAGFHEITPARSSFKATDEIDEQTGPGDEEQGQSPSLLRQQLQQAGLTGRENAIQDGSERGMGDGGTEDEPLLSRQNTVRRIASNRVDDIFLSASPISTSYGTSYGTLASRINESSMRHAAQLFKEQQVTGVQEPEGGREPLLVKCVEREDGTIVAEIIGQSTLPQTISNSINVLIGVGLLGLPMGIKYAGWAIGMPMLLFAAICTSYTAKLLAKCLDVDKSLVTFADLAYISFGHPARVITSILFTLELLAANVALVVLFADSLNALVDSWGILEFKILCGLFLIPLCFVPMRWLSFSSTLGILCCFGIVLITFIDGLIKPHTPGSLREPAKTYLFPADWRTLPLSFGLLMSPWGGHSVFPNLYRDMRHPQKYGRAVKTTYTFTYLLDLSMAVAGLLMFGDSVRDEVTANLLLTIGYPQATKFIIIILVSIIPLTKIPLNAFPIVSTLEIFSGLDPRALPATDSMLGMSGFTRGFLKAGIRVFTISIIVVIAIVFPAFDRIMALMGSALCFTICIILPLSFHLKIFGKEIPLKERVLNWSLIIICSTMAAVGTVWAFLPRDKIGAD